MAGTKLLFPSQRGSMLLEGLIAILIFSVGILAIVGMQGSAIKATTDAKYRSDAGLLANQLIGSMWVSDRTTATLQSNFGSPGGAAYVSWRDEVVNALPGVVVNPAANLPTVVIDGAGMVTVTVYWKAPNDKSAHQYVAIAQVR